MPLEQIRTVAALNSSESLRRASYFSEASTSYAGQSHSRDDDASDSDREHADHDDDGDADLRRYSASSRKSGSMSLSKLGGVGGVTRSGSWGRNSLSDDSQSARQPRDESRHSLFRPLRSSLARYPEESDEEETCHVRSSTHSSDLPSASVVEGTPDRRASEGDHVRGAASVGCDAHPDRSASSGPPASSRTSTASSAAAFSLRSLSNRNSTGSVSSLASSVVSRSDADRLTPAPPTESPVSLDPALSIKSPPEALTSSSSSTSLTAPASPTRTESTDPALPDTRHVPRMDEGPRASADPAAMTTQPPDMTAGAVSDDLTQPSSCDATEPIPQVVNVVATVSDPVSPPPGKAGGQADTLSPESSLQPSAEELLSSSSAAGIYSPLIPRRHSGMIMLRSRSQLALHSGLTMTFANAGGGRAAARERARKQTGWENAPFSVLEAQRHTRSFAYSQPASPGASSSTIAWDPSASPALLLPSATATEAALFHSPQLASRPLDRNIGSPESSPSTQSSGQIAVPAQRPPPPTRQKSEHTLSRAALTRLDTVLGCSVNEPADPVLPSSADAAATSMLVGSRMQPIRSPSGSAILGSSSLLRTPTTEEWSRYLESQGVGLAGRRSRTGTNLSSGSSAQRVNRLAMSGLPSPSKAEFEAGGADFGDDSDLDSDDSDDHDLGVEVLEKLKQLGLSRAASRAGSVLGDELTSLHEEDEDNLSPVSPHVAATDDATPLTPLASGPKILPLQGTPVQLFSGSPGTPQAGFERGATLRLPRSKRPTMSGDPRLMGPLYPQDFKGEKSIADFEIVSDVGRGAYGLVKKARKKGPDGRPQGDEVVIKYIIKSRILADCWRRHRVLGPIPVEIHVMDQLRRIAYVPPSKTRPWAPQRLKTLEEYRAHKRGEAAGEEAKGSEALSTSATPSHPNICKMLDFFEDHEFYYLVMPCFGRGQDLFDFVESAPDGLAASQCRTIFGQVADALWFLHANNIVHRDIKDENVILDGEGNAQLIDFGSAAHVRPGKLFDTFSGTLDYAAAEILQGEKYSGQAQDVWALGVVGFVLLCGECPFWNGEEAVQGLEAGTRAAQTLKERCLIARVGPAEADSGLTEHEVELAPLDPAWSRSKDKEGAEPDGGGRVDDFVDLISRCLELEVDARPTAEQICQHRFLAGHAGWTGRRGWQRLKAPLVTSCSVPAEGKGSQFITAAVPSA